MLRFLEEFLVFVEQTSPKDGLVGPLARADSVKSIAVASRSTNESLLSSQQIRRLVWDLDEAALRALQEAGKRINKLVSPLPICDASDRDILTTPSSRTFDLLFSFLLLSRYHALLGSSKTSICMCFTSATSARASSSSRR